MKAIKSKLTDRNVGSIWALVLWLCLLGSIFNCGDSQNAGEPESSGLLIEYDRSLVGKPVQEMLEQEMAGIRDLRGESEDTAALAARWQKLGMIFHAYQLRNQATKAYEQAIALQPENWELYYLQGLVLVDLVASRKAAETMEKALELKPDNALITFRLARLARNQGNLERSEALFKRAVEADPQLAVAFVGLAEIQLERGEVQSALSSLEKADELQPDVSRTQYLLAQAYRDLGDDEKAEASLAKSESSKKSLRFRDPLQDRVDAYAQIGANLIEEGDMAMRVGNVGVALDAYQQAVAYNPRDFVAIAKMGNALMRNGNYEGALEAYRNASAINPGNALLQYNIGSTLMEAGQFEQAVAFFEKALQLEPKLAEAAMRLGDSSRLRGDWQAALDFYDKALGIEPDYASAKMGRAVCLLALERRVEAKNYLLATWKESFENPVVGRVLSRVLVSSPEPEARDAEQAMQIVNILEEKAPGTYLLETKAMAHAELGEFKKALETLKIAMGTAQMRGDSAVLESLAAQFKAYEQGQTWRQPYLPAHPLFHQPTY